MMNAHGALLMGALLLAGCDPSGSESKNSSTGTASATAGADTGAMRTDRMDSGGMGRSRPPGLRLSGTARCSLGVRRRPGDGPAG